MAGPKVSVIIVNHNGKHLLMECLESVFATEAAGEEVIVVDNASTDGSVEGVTSEFPSVRVLGMDANLGFSEANNKGVEAAGGEYVLFLNNDTKVTPGWMDALCDTISSDPSIGAVGSKLLLFGIPEKDGRVNSAGADIIVNGGAFDVGLMEEDSERFNAGGPKGAVCAASMMMRRDVFVSLGGFDSMYFMFFEDVDLCWRCWLYGYKVIYEPRSVVYHRYGSSAGSDLRSPFRVFHGTKNVLLNVMKNFGRLNLMRALFLNAAIHSSAFVLYLLWRRPGSSLAIARAYWHVLVNLGDVMRKRGKVQGKRKIPDRYMFEHSLVVSLGEARREYLRVRRSMRDAAGFGNNSKP